MDSLLQPLYLFFIKITPHYESASSRAFALACKHRVRCNNHHFLINNHYPLNTASLFSFSEKNAARCDMCNKTRWQLAFCKPPVIQRFTVDELAGGFYVGYYIEPLLDKGLSIEIGPDIFASPLCHELVGVVPGCPVHIKGSQSLYLCLKCADCPAGVPARILFLKDLVAYKEDCLGQNKENNGKNYEGGGYGKEYFCCKSHI